MQHLYIDESGSMTNQYVNTWPYFVIAIVRADNPDRLRRLHKRFVVDHMEELKKVDYEGKMFRGESFRELKGSAFSPDLKRAFASYFCKDNALEVFYIILDNVKVSRNLYDNTARAFNYVLKLALEFFIHKGVLSDDEYILQLDERNERTNAKHFLQNYLNTELRMEGVLSKDVRVQYFDSANNKIIQVADVLANLYYSQLRTKNYTEEIAMMTENGCLKKVFTFPPT